MVGRPTTIGTAVARSTRCSLYSQSLWSPSVSQSVCYYYSLTDWVSGVCQSLISLFLVLAAFC